MSGSTAQELLQNIKKGAHYGNLQLGDVEEILSNELFSRKEGLLVVTDPGQSTLLHLAAQTLGDTVLPLVCQAYKRSKLFSDAMAMVNNAGLSPLHVAIQAGRFENAILLFKECQERCPRALEPDQDGWTLLHSAALLADNVNIVKYLLNQKSCQHMVLCKGKSSRRRFLSLPRDVARDTVSQAEFQLKNGEDQLERFCKQAKLNQFARDTHARTLVEPKKKVLEKARELYSHIEQTTLELKASEAEQRVKDLEKSKVIERQENLNKELEELLLKNNWESVESNYLLSESEETRKLSVKFLTNRLQSETFSLPALTLRLLSMLSTFLNLPEEDPCVLSTLKLLEGYSKNPANAELMLTAKDECILSTASHLLSSLSTHIQSVTTSLLLQLVSSKRFSSAEHSDMSSLQEALHLLKHFSTSLTVRKLSQEVLVRLGADQTPPNPGSWSTRQVSLWLDNISELDRRAQYLEEFRKANIDGLHLLELSVGEMTGLGVKFVSHQRTLADKIDELRRMNARSMVGRKDVFLSYAHININFARRLKSVLNNADYSVWIDEAGIRAGQKWRNEIADGIQGCGVFLLLLSKRSSNSQYCQNEVAMAETYGKPMVTVKIEQLGEVDPGLQFIIGRRQWLDFSDEDTFQSRSQTLLDTMASLIGPGKTTQSDEVTDAPLLKHLPDKPPKHAGNVELGPGLLVEEMEKLRVAIETQLTAMTERMAAIEGTVTTLASRVSALEQKIP